MHVYGVFADVSEHLGERSRIDSNFFRQRRCPFGRLRFFRPTRSSVRDDAERQRKHGHGPSSVAVLSRVARLPGAAPRQLNSVRGLTLWNMRSPGRTYYPPLTTLIGALQRIVFIFLRWPRS